MGGNFPMQIRLKHIDKVVVFHVEVTHADEAHRALGIDHSHEGAEDGARERF